MSPSTCQRNKQENETDQNQRSVNNEIKLIGTSNPAVTKDRISF